MATRKLIVRIGTAATVPTLEVGEPGWDTDKKTARFGDGTAQPPRVMTDKSSGKFDYRDVDSVKFKQIELYDGGEIDGVTPHALNQNNGIVVRAGDNVFEQKAIEGQTDYVTIENGTGAATGNIIVKLNSTLIDKLGRIKIIEVGTTGERPIDANSRLGDLRYNTDTALFEGYTDAPTKSSALRAWRSLPTISDAAVVYDYGVDFNSIEAFKAWVKNRVISNKVSLRFPSGKSQFSGETWNFDDCLTKNIEILGQDPVELPLNVIPVNSVTGSSNSWNVTYQLTSAIPNDINVGSYVIVDIPTFAGLTGTCSSYEYSAADAAVLPTKTTITSFTEPGVVNIDISKGWLLSVCNGLKSQPSQLGVFARKVQSVSTNSVSLLSAFPYAPQVPQFYVADQILNTTANLSTSTNQIQITGSDPSKTIDPEDLVFFFLPSQPAKPCQCYRVQSVNSTSISIYGLPTAALSGATVLYIKTGITAHAGAWRVASLDRLNNRVTLENKVYNQAPSNYSVKGVKLYWMPSVIERTNGGFDHLTGFSAGTTITLKNIVFNCGVQYTSRCCYFKNAKVVLEGKVGFTRWRKAIRFDLSDVIGSGTEALVMSDILSVDVAESNGVDDACVLDIKNSRVQFNRIISTGNGNGYGKGSIYSHASGSGYIQQLIGSGNYSAAIQLDNSNFDILNFWAAFNGPASPDTIFTGLSKVSLRYYNLISKTLGAPIDIEPNGPQPSFAGPLYVVNANLAATKGLISAHNSAAVIVAGSSEGTVEGTLYQVYAPLHSCFYSFARGNMSLAYSSIYYQGPRLFHFVDNGLPNFFVSNVDGAYNSMGVIRNNTKFNAALCAIPPGSASQFDLYIGSQAVASAIEPPISFTNNSGSTSYSA